MDIHRFLINFVLKLQPDPEYRTFMVDKRAGEQWIRLNKKFGVNEDIKVDVTMFDRSVPVKKSGGGSKEDEVYLHLTMIVDIFKGEDNDVLEFVCSVLPDSIEIHKVIMRGHGPIAAQSYTGPRFKYVSPIKFTVILNFLKSLILYLQLSLVWLLTIWKWDIFGSIFVKLCYLP